MKFALVSNVLPPSGTAHAALIFRLLGELDPHRYVLLSSTDYPSLRTPLPSAALPGRYFHLAPVLGRLAGDAPWLPRAVRRLTAGPAVALRAKAIARVLRQERCDAVVVLYGRQRDRRRAAGSGARFHANVLDQYSHMASYGLGNSFLRHFDGRILRRASAVIVPSEPVQREIERRHTVDSAVIHNPCDLGAVRPQPSREEHPGPRFARVLGLPEPQDDD